MCRIPDVGMKHLLARQMAHRDLRSPNVFICKEDDGTLVCPCSIYHRMHVQRQIEKFWYCGQYVCSLYL